MDELMVIRAIHGAAKLSNVAFDAVIDAIKDETNPAIDMLCGIANECEDIYVHALILMIEGNSVECKEHLEAVETCEQAAAGFGMACYAGPVLRLFP